MQQYESEKSTLVMEHQRRLDELQRDRTSEVENLRAVQRFVYRIIMANRFNFPLLFVDKLLIIYGVNMIKLFNV